MLTQVHLILAVPSLQVFLVFIFNCACVSVCLHVGMCTCGGQRGPPGARVTGRGGPLGMGARN